MAAGDYALKVTVTNFLGVSDSASFTFTKAAAGDEVPVISIIGDSQQNFKVAEGIKVETQLMASSVCPGKKVWQEVSLEPRGITCVVMC